MNLEQTIESYKTRTACSLCQQERLGLCVNKNGLLFVSTRTALCVNYWNKQHLKHQFNSTGRAGAKDAGQFTSAINNRYACGFLPRYSTSFQLCTYWATE